MPDMIVNLYTLQENNDEEELNKKGITIKRALMPDKHWILKFVRENFTSDWEDECECALFNKPVSCYIAVKDGDLMGFACYDATAKDFFGPIGVKEEERHSGIGKVLLYKCMKSMKDDGYGYAIIGWAEEAIKFYEKSVGAVIIPNATPQNSVYRNLIKFN